MRRIEIIATLVLGVVGVATAATPALAANRPMPEGGPVYDKPVDDRPEPRLARRYLALGRELSRLSRKDLLSMRRNCLGLIESPAITPELRRQLRELVSRVERELALRGAGD